VDAHVVAEIAAASPDLADAGTEFSEAILRAAQLVVSNGYQPSILAMGTDFAMSFLIDTVPAVGFYLYAVAAIEKYQKVVVAGLPADTAYMIDPAAAGELHVSPVTTRVFEENSGQTNTSTVRIESNGTFIVQRIGAIAEVNAPWLSS